ncbi:MAG: hypothetical protein ACRDQ5_11805, partial [Sciscionella sp.]
VGPAATALLSALLPEACPVPVVIAESIPSWVGALDVVLAHCDDPADPVLAESVALAARRGARILLSAPPNGPVAAAAAGSAALVPPRVDVPLRFAFPKVFTAGLVLVETLGLLHTDLDALADALDAEAARNQPAQESFVNPAKSLALRLAERTPLLWGTDLAGTAVAEHAAQTLAAHAGMVSDVASYQQATTRPALHRAAVASTSGKDIFADPDDDDDLFGERRLLRVLLIGVQPDSSAEPSRWAAGRALPGADLIDPVAEIAEGEHTVGRPPDGDLTLSDPIAMPGPATAVRNAGVLALRFEMAALYLGLAAGTLGGPGRLAPAAL